MTIKEEFQKAYLTAPYGKQGDMNHLECALWGAKWMAERCASEADKWCFSNVSAKEASYKIVEEIRQLAKELEP